MYDRRIISVMRYENRKGNCIKAQYKRPRELVSNVL